MITFAMFVNQVCINVHDKETNNFYVWSRNKFLNRQVHMSELYQTFESSGHLPRVTHNEDPFWEPADTEVMIGIVVVPLNYLSHMLDFTDETLSIIDYKAKQVRLQRVSCVLAIIVNPDVISVCFCWQGGFP